VDSWSEFLATIQRSGFYSKLYQFFIEVVGLERDPLSLMSAIEELHGRKRSGCGLQSRETAAGIRCGDHTTPSMRKCWH
jgi:hypothetical protein